MLHTGEEIYGKPPYTSKHVGAVSAALFFDLPACFKVQAGDSFAASAACLSRHSTRARLHVPFLAQQGQRVCLQHTRTAAGPNCELPLSASTWLSVWATASRPCVAVLAGADSSAVLCD